MSNSESNFRIIIQAMLDKVKSIANIRSDIKAIEPKLPKVKVQGKLDKTATQKELNSKIKMIRPKVKVDADITQAEKKIKKIGKQKNKTTITPTVDNTQVVTDLKQAQKETKTLWERFTNDIIGSNLVRMALQRVIQAIREAIVTVKELDTIKTNIQMVSGTSDSDVNAMMSSYNAVARGLSSTTKDVAEAANEFLRMGESIQNTNELIRSSQILSKVGMIESADAAGYLISSLKGYQVAAEDSLDIVSKLTSVDLEAAVSAGGLSEALSKCANIANDSGVSMDRLIGYTATVGETTQKSMSEVGNSFQALLSRMNNIKIGRFIDDETGESLSDTEAVLDKLGIQLRDTENTYRSFDDVLDDVGSRWESFTKAEQNALSVAIAGTRQRENFEALMNNWGNALKYSETAANSAGSALERYGVYQDSIEAKTNELTAALESLSTNTISEGLYSGIIEATTGIVEFLDKTNLLKASLTGLVAMGVTKAIAFIGAGFITAAKSTVQLSAAMALFDKGKSVDNLRNIGGACKGLSDKQLKLVLSIKGLINEDRKLILEGMGVAEAEREQMLTTLGFAAAEDKATVSTFSLKGAMKSLWATIVTNPVGFILTGIAATVSIATIAISKHNQNLEEARLKAAELAEAYKQQQASLDSQIDKYRELKESLDKGNLSTDEARSIKEQLLEIQNSLAESYGDEASNIDLVNGKYREQLGLLSKLSKEKANDFIIEHRDIYNEAKRALEAVKIYDLGTVTGWSNIAPQTEDQKRLIEFIESYSDLLELSYQGHSASYGGNDYVAAVNLSVKANVVDADEFMHQFAKDLEQYISENNIDVDVSGLLENGIPEQIRNTWTDELKEYKEIYDEFMKAEIVRNDTLRPLYQQSIQAVEDYNNALSSGKGIDEAKANLDAVQQSVQNATGELEDSQEVFDGIYDGINRSAESAYNLGQAFEKDESVKGYAEQLKGLTDIDLQAINFQDKVQSPGEEAFGALIDILGLSEDEVQNLIDKLVELGYVQGEVQSSTLNFENPPALSISDTVDQLNTQLKPALDSLQSAYQDIFMDDGFALNSIDILSTCNTIKSKLDEMSDPEGLNLDVDYSSYEDFVRVLNNTESTEQDVETAFDSLATSIVKAALTGKEDFSTMKAALEDLGVANNEIVAFDALISNTEALKEAGLDLANATEEQVAEFADAMVSAENYDQAINLLRIQKILCNENPLSTAEDINELYRLAQAAGIAANAVQQLMGLNSAYEIAAESGNTIASTAVKIQMDMVRKQVVDQFSQLKTDVDFSEIGGGASKAKSAGKDAGKSYTDALKDELSNLNSVIGYISDTIDKQIDLFEEQKDAAIDALEAEKEAAEEALEAEKELVQEKIDAKQAEIDAIEDAAQARKNALDLQKAQYDLERMQNQKTMLVYSENKGMHYVTDTREIREARDKITEAKENIRIANMEKEISGLSGIIDGLDKKIEESNEYYDKLIEETEKYWDGLIKGLEEYKSRWQELADMEEQAKMEACLQRLGITTEDVLNMSESAFESFKGIYLGLLNEMYSGNDEMIGMLQRLGGISTDALKPLSGTIGAVAESLDRYAGSVSTADINTVKASENIGALNTNTAGLQDNLSSVSGTLNDILEEGKLETAAGQLGDVAKSIQSVADALNDMPSEMDLGGIAGQFDAFGNSVDRVSASISGGNAPKADTSDVVAGKNTSNTQGKSGSNGSNSLVSAIKEVKAETDHSIGTGGDSGAIGRFNQLGESVADVTAAIGGGESGERKEDSGETSGDLIQSMETLGETAAGILGEPDGEGVTGKFGELGGIIAEAEGHVQGIIDKMEELDGMTAECSIVVNVQTAGGVPAYAEGTAISDTAGSMGSGEYHPKYEGKAHVEGTANVSGNWGVSEPGRSLVGEVGQELWIHAKNGTFETVGDNGPEFIHTDKNDIIFNHLQTQELLKRGNLAGRGKICNGKAYIDGTNGVVVTPNGNVLTPYNPDLDTSEFGKLYKAWNKHFGTMDDNAENIRNILTQYATMEYNQKMHNEVNNFISRGSNIANNNRNIQPSITFGDINVTCPGITDKQVAQYVPAAVKRELIREFTGFSNFADQWSRRR